MTSRATSLSLLGSYGKDEDEVEGETSETTTMVIETTSISSTTTTTTSTFQLVGYEHDEGDEQEHDLGENAGRAVIILNPPKPHTSELGTTTPPPSSPIHTTSTTTINTTSTTPPTSSSLRGKILHSSPFKCDAFLPPEDQSVPVNPDIQARVARYFALMSGGKNINDVRYSKNYKNPDILEKLVEHCGVNEIGSNYPVELFNPNAFEPHDYYESIAAEQRRMEEKRNDDRAGRTNIEFTSSSSVSSSTSSKVSTDDKKRSKWDSMEPSKQQIVTIVSGTAAPPAPPTANAYVEYIRDRKKREGAEAAREANNKKSKK